MRHRVLARHAFIHAAIASIYIGVVGLLFYSGQDVLETRNGPLAVTAYLLLVVVLTVCTPTFGLASPSCANWARAAFRSARRRSVPTHRTGAPDGRSPSGETVGGLLGRAQRPR